MSRFLRPLCGIVALTTFGTLSAGAQAMTVTANVPESLTGAVVTSLSFGVVLPSATPKTIGVTHASAGKWKVTGTNNNEVSLTLAYPQNLTASGNNLPVTFTACHNTLDAAAGCAPITMGPTSATVATRLSATTPGNLYVFLGGSVSPGLSPVPGSYTGQVTLSFNYTGN